MLAVYSSIKPKSRALPRAVCVSAIVGLLICEVGCRGTLQTAQSTIDGLELLAQPGSSVVEPALAGPPPNVAGIQNPLVVPYGDREFIWNQLVDTIDDYFDITTERRVQQMGGVLTEGLIETKPQVGATAFEPWRWDSTPGFELAHATLQTVRRRAIVQVTPNGQGLSVYVVVRKELEDLSRPEFASPGSSIPRHDAQLFMNRNTSSLFPQTLGWIDVGRDAELEAEIVREMQGRLFQQPDAPPAEVM